MFNKEEYEILFIAYRRVKGQDRQKWISIIAAHQPLTNVKTIYICDLHFDRNDLSKNGKHFRPKKNILPLIVNNRYY